MEKAYSYQEGSDYCYDIPVSKQNCFATVVVGVVSSDCGGANKPILRLSFGRNDDDSLVYYVEECDDPDASIMSKTLPNFFEKLLDEYMAQ